MVDWWIPVQALWLMVPAYAANMAPVFLARLFPRWDRPIDGGLTRPDGTRLLGEGKTWRGLWGGAVVAALFALLLAEVLRFDARLTDFGTTEHGRFWAPLALGFFFGFGALAGDAVKSYFKRRTGRQRGQPWIGPDQLDFLIGGLFFVGLLGLILPTRAGNDPWTIVWLIERWWLPLFLLIATPVLHWAVNVIGYWLKLKKEPW